MLFLPLLRFNLLSFHFSSLGVYLSRLTYQVFSLKLHILLAHILNAHKLHRMFYVVWQYNIHICCPSSKSYILTLSNASEGNQFYYQCLRQCHYIYTLLSAHRVIKSFFWFFISHSPLLFEYHSIFIQGH